MALLTGCSLTFCYKFLSVSTVLFVQKKYMCSKHFPVEHTRKLKIVVRLKPKLMGCLCILCPQCLDRGAMSCGSIFFEIIQQ